MCIRDRYQRRVHGEFKQMEPGIYDEECTERRAAVGNLFELLNPYYYAYPGMTSQFPFQNPPEKSVNKAKKKASKSAKKKKSTAEDFQVKYKTEMCKSWQTLGRCKFGDSCAFAHGDQELRSKSHVPIKYKTRKCLRFHYTGFCPYGDRCQFLHEEEALPRTKCYGSYGMELQCMSEANGTCAFASQDSMNHPRLPLFKSFAERETTVSIDAPSGVPLREGSPVNLYAKIKEQVLQGAGKEKIEAILEDPPISLGSDSACFQISRVVTIAFH
eukprot:TRINITY_DN6030_c0_g1_i1.p1 TRINITY_DN6030_c0_g1~~TRINITY_DN6030_c0_g1_i1.p1  ORF type:complete len:272 (-),score=36.51 TRINITY_DN6030_c0_g1_i1:17-832(-)